VTESLPVRNLTVAPTSGCFVSASFSLPLKTGACEKADWKVKRNRDSNNLNFNIKTT
jgi:hypothetical protein